MYERVYYATHPQMMEGASNQDLRDRHCESWEIDRQSAGEFPGAKPALDFGDSDQSANGGLRRGQRDLERWVDGAYRNDAAKRFPNDSRDES